NVLVHVAAIRLQVDDRVADDLPRTVIRDIAAASGLVDLDAAGRQRVGRGEDVRSAAVAAHAERQHVRMLDEHQRVDDLNVPPGTSSGLSCLLRARFARSATARLSPSRFRSSAFLTTGTMSPQSSATAMPTLTSL